MDRSPMVGAGGARDAPLTGLLDFPACLLPVSLSGKRLLDPLLFSRLQVEGMAFDFFDDVFLLHLPFEAAKGIFQSFALLELHFSQSTHTSQLDHKFSHALKGRY